MMHTDEMFQITLIAFRYGSMAWEQLETVVNAGGNPQEGIDEGEVAAANVDLIRDILVELGELGVDTYDVVEQLNLWLDEATDHAA